MNKMAEVAALYGLELGDRFKIKGSENGDVYMFTEQGLASGDNKKDEYSYPGTLARILRGEREIERIPWKPKEGEPYWYIGNVGNLPTYTKFTHDDIFDLMNYKCGNCFKTAQQATENTKKVVAMFDDIRKELEQ